MASINIKYLRRELVDACAEHYETLLDEVMSNVPDSGERAIQYQNHLTALREQEVYEFEVALEAKLICIRSSWMSDDALENDSVA